MKKIFPLILATLITTLAAAALDAPPVNPTNQPLIVLRAANGDTIETVLDTRQAKALGLDKKDYSGPIPGVEAQIDSLRAFAAALAYGKAQNIWYCLSQRGSSLANQTGAMGWDAVDSNPQAPLPQVTKWLGDLGLNIEKQDLEVRPIDDNHARIIISRDSESRQEILGGTGSPDNGWRNNLTQFVNDKEGGLGIWANTRPLLGLLSILTGIDFRSKMNAHNMGVPVSAQVELYNNKGDLGLSAKLNNILPDEWKRSETQPLLIQTRPDALIDLNFPTPAGLWDILDLKTDTFFLANINILPLIPRSINVATWRDDKGETHWSLVSLMGDKEKFNEQLKRLHSWMQVISAVSSSSFGLDTAKSNWGDELWSVRIGPDSFVMGVVDVEAAGRDNAFLVVSGSSGDWPNPFELKVTPAANDTLVHWNVNLDDESHREFAKALADMSKKQGADNLTESFYEQFLPVTDTGWVSMEGKSIRLESTHGLMPMLIPAVHEMLRQQINPEAPGMQKVASRLRFLLDLAGQSRFRSLVDANAVPAKLPTDLSELLFSDTQGRAWLDGEFGKFPDAFQNVSEILGALASGEGIDGFRYHINSGPDGWNVNAENSQGSQMRIDSQGNLSVMNDGNWTSYIEPLVNISQYFR